MLSRFLTATNTRARGREGEQAARGWLERQGFEILSTNYRARPGEIDIIAREGTGETACLCFVEIKARANNLFGSAIGAVTTAKQRRIGRAASIFLATSEWEGPCRFDVLGIERAGESWEFNLIRDAFGYQPEG